MSTKIPPGIAGLMVAVCLGALAPAGPARALDLATVLRQVETRNPSVEARAAQVEVARRRVPQAGAWSPPMLELGVANVPTSSWALDEDEMTMKMIGLAQKVPISGANALRRRAAREEVSAAQADLATTRYQRLGEAWQAYADAFFASALAADTKDHAGVMERIVAAARARYQSGRGRLDDMLRAESERARTFADAALYQSEEQGARARLDALRGAEPGPPGEPLEAPPLPGSSDLAAWLPSETHPRLAAAEARARRYRTSARAARRMIWPELDLRVTYGMRGTVMDMELDDMVTATVGLMLPIFAGSRERAEAAELEAMARATDAERREASLALAGQVRAAHASAVAAGRQAQILADTVLVAGRKAVDAAWSAYEAGTVDLWRVLESSHSLYQQEIALVRARQELARAHGRLVALTGRTDLLGVAPAESGTEER